MSKKRRFVWLWALPFAILGGCLLAMVFFVVGASFVENGDDLIMAFAYGLFFMVAPLGAIVGAFFGLLLAWITPKKWGAWGAILAGLVAAVISGVAVAAFVITL